MVGVSLLPTSIPGTKHILAYKLPLGILPLQLIATVGQWEEKINLPLSLLGHRASVWWEEGMGHVCLHAKFKMQALGICGYLPSRMYPSYLREHDIK